MYCKSMIFIYIYIYIILKFILFVYNRYTGVIKLPILGGIKQYTFMMILRDFPYSNALFGLVI